jgi:HEAT repeat protein
MELLRGGGDSGGQAAARAIKNLSAGHASSAKVRFATAGAVPLLVKLLRAPKDATRRAAASALWNLAYRNNANRKEIVRAGAIPPLVRLLTVSPHFFCGGLGALYAVPPWNSMV